MLPPDKSDPRTETLVKTHKGYDWRIVTFYPVVFALLLTVAAGFAYQQLFKTGEYAENEKLQSQRRIITPGPRGEILDREGRLLVGNVARYAITMNLDELRAEFRRTYLITRRNYREADDKNIPTSAELWSIARRAVMQGYLDQVNAITGRSEKIDAASFHRHFNQKLLIPYTLVEDLTLAEYARLTEQLPPNSPLRLTATSKRQYPGGNTAAHVLGFVQANDEINVENFPGDELTTFRMPGMTGKNGLELRFDERLQGKAGGVIYRVDPSGHRIEPPLHRVAPRQGDALRASIDIDLQQAAEKAMGDIANGGYAGAAVALDVRTGEVLVLSSKPDYDLNSLSPRISRDTYDKIEEQGAWLNRAIAQRYQPGSTFKLITTIAGFRNGKLQPSTTFNCPGYLRVGNRDFACHDRHVHNDINFNDALAKSCNVFFYREGLELGAQAIADEARRFGLDRPTGIELPYETKNMVIPDPAWKRRFIKDSWAAGDTVMMAIGQSYIVVTPLGMACFIASVARDETHTPPTLLHDPDRPPLKTAPIGLTPAQRAALVEAMRDTMRTGTGRILGDPRGMYRLGHLDIAGKSGTAQFGTGVKKLNFAWFIAYAPASNPRIAAAVVLEGDIPGEELGGGLRAAPIIGEIFKKYFEKHPDQIPRPPAAGS